MLDTVTDHSLLSLMQLCDSNFPTGAFSHSFGLETYIQEEKVFNKSSFVEWLKVYIGEQLVYIDGLACRLALEALGEGNLQKVWLLDRKINVQNFARETREANNRMAERMIHLGLELYESPILAKYQTRVKAKEAHGHSAIVFAMIAQHLHIPESKAVLAYLYSSIASLIQNGVRGIPLGQTEGQRIYLELQSSLTEAASRIYELDENDLGITSPGLELSQMRHERLNIRLFMS